MFSHQGPVLSLCWNKVRLLRVYSLGPKVYGDLQEGNRVISAGADSAGRMYDVQTGQSTQIAKHDAPIRVIKYVDPSSGGIVVTGSWDKTIKVRNSCPPSILAHAQSVAQYWDIRSQNPVSSVTLPERCYSLDVSYPLMVVGTAERHIQIFNLTSPTAVYKVSSGSLEFF